MKKKDRWIAIGMASLMTMLLIACGAKESNDQQQAQNNEEQNKQPAQTTTAKDTKVENDGSYDNCTLTFSWWGGDSRHAATIDAIAAFQEKYPGIIVETTYGTERGIPLSISALANCKAKSWRGYRNKAAVKMIDIMM